MREVERNGVHIDVCTKCKGVWLDRGELEKMLSGMRGAAAEFDRERDEFERERAAYRAPNPSQMRPPEPRYEQPRYDERRPQGGEGGEGYGYGQKKKRSWMDAFDIFD
jgi:uncharacterized protein